MLSDHYLEKMILGKALLKQTYALVIKSKLCEEDFTLNTHAQIFRLIKTNQDVDLAKLYILLVDHKLKDSVGIIYITETIDAGIGGGDVDYMTDKLMELTYRRCLKRRLQDTILMIEDRRISYEELKKHVRDLK